MFICPSRCRLLVLCGATGRAGKKPRLSVAVEGRAPPLGRRRSRLATQRSGMSSASVSPPLSRHPYPTAEGVCGMLCGPLRYAPVSQHSLERVL